MPLHLGRAGEALMAAGGPRKIAIREEPTDLALRAAIEGVSAAFASSLRRFTIVPNQVSPALIVRHSLV